MTGESCSSCLELARRRGVTVGMLVPIRSGHVGVVTLIHHSSDRAQEAVFVLVHDTDERETLYLSLSAVAARLAWARSAA